MRLTVCILLLFFPVVCCAVSNETITPLPATQPNASSYTQTRTFLRDELPAVLSRYFRTDFVVAGGVHGTSVTMISPDFVTEAFTTAGNRVTGDGNGGPVSINYSLLGCAATDTAYVIASAASANTLGNFVRSGTSNYFVDCTSTTPSLPANSVWLMQVTISGSALTAVTDIRLPASYVHRGVFDVADALYGAVDDNATNARAAIQAAITQATRFSGTVLFSKNDTGIYYVSGADTRALLIPAANANYQAELQTIPYQFNIENVTGLRLQGDGITIRSDYAFGGIMFLFDGCRDITWDGITLQSVTAFSPTTGVITVAGMNALGITSQSQDSERIQIRNFRTVAAYTGLYVFGDGASAYRVRSIMIDGYLAIDNVYGMAFHDNGNNVDFRGVRTLRGLRAYFIYGVERHKGQLEVTDGVPTFEGVLIKAYDQRTAQIELQVRYNRTSSVDRIALQSQHNTGVQALPATVRDITIDLNEQDLSGAGSSVNFSYYQSTVLQTSSSLPVFNNITLRGIFERDITTSTTFNNAGIARINIDDAWFVSGSPSILNGNQGFYAQRVFTYTPALLIDASTTGISYLVQNGEYWTIGNMVFGNIDINLSLKGASIGQVTFTLPVTISPLMGVVPLFTVIGYSGFAGLTGSLQAYGSIGTTTAVLSQSGPTGTTQVDQNNITDNARLLVSFTYAK